LYLFYQTLHVFYWIISNIVAISLTIFESLHFTIKKFAFYLEFAFCNLTFI
jgi:hypothetical protein